MPGDIRRQMAGDLSPEVAVRADDHIPRVRYVESIEPAPPAGTIAAFAAARPLNALSHATVRNSTRWYSGWQSKPILVLNARCRISWQLLACYSGCWARLVGSL